MSLSTALDLGKYSKVVGDDRVRLREHLAREYARGSSIRDLASRYNRSYGFVHGLLVEAGAEFRPRGALPRNYQTA